MCTTPEVRGFTKYQGSEKNLTLTVRKIKNGLSKARTSNAAIFAVKFQHTV
ncbi:hypothetical protein TH47_14715 [Thalassospira sp. MCCC 1A02803]|nr:hypothetical protein TH47_14715 [Thalassospira sp. MCCC 1A02803]